MLGGLLVGLGVVLIGIILEYAIRQPRTDYFPWNDIDQVVLEPGKRRACLVYRHPKHPQKSCSLAFRLDEDYERFVTAVRNLAPTKVKEGKIGSAVSPVIWGLLIFLVALILFAFVMISLFPSRPNP